MKFVGLPLIALIFCSCAQQKAFVEVPLEEGRSEWERYVGVPIDSPDAYQAYQKKQTLEATELLRVGDQLYLVNSKRFGQNGEAPVLNTRITRRRRDAPDFSHESTMKLALRLPD